MTGNSPSGMAETKSKIPVRRPVSEDARTRPSRSEDSRKIDRQRTSFSESGHASKNKYDTPEDEGSAVLEIISFDNGKGMLDENDFERTSQTGQELRVRKHTVTIKDRKGNLVSQKKSYKLTYDPERPAGNEYMVETSNGEQIDGNTINGETDSLNDVTELLINAKNNEKEIKADTLTVHSNKTFTRSRADSTTSSILFTRTRSKVSLSARTNLLRQKIDVRSTSSTDTEKTTRSNKSPAQNDKDSSKKLDFLNVQPVREPRLLSPDDRSETNILFKVGYKTKTVRNALNASKTKENDIENSNPTSSKQTPADIKPAVNCTLILNSKENSPSSLPPPNFKTNLFTRPRKISTPRRFPRFSPVPVVSTHSKVPNNQSSLVHKHIDDPNDLETNAEAIAIHSDITFIKDTGAKRSERLTSAESIGGHDSKKLKREEEGTDVVDEMDKTLDKVIENDEDRYEDVNSTLGEFVLKPKRHKRSGVSVPIDNAVTIGSNSADAHNHTSNTESMKITSANIGNRSIESGISRRTVSTNELFNESDQKARLKQAQYITADLRIMKTKLKDTDFIVKHLDADMRRTVLGKAVLKKLNKTKTRQQQAYRTSQGNKNLGWSKLLHAKTSNNRPTDNTETILPDPTTLLGKKERLRIQSPDKHSQVQSKQFKRNPKPISLASLQSKITDLTWRVQAKIHRFDSNKAKHNRNSDVSENFTGLPIEDNRTGSVAKWVLHSASGTKSSKLSASEFSHTTATMSTFRRRKQLSHKHKRRPSENKSESSPSTNLINAGMYMPIKRKRLKRKPMLLTTRLYTRVGKEKGYEVGPRSSCSNVFCSVLYQ